MTHAPNLYATFYIAGMHFGIEVVHVQELIRFQEITPVPLAPPAVEGLMNLRGQLVTAIDMRRKLGLPPRKPDSAPMNIVVRAGDGVVSLLADEVGDVVEPPVDCYEAVPETMRAEEKDVLECVCKLDRELLLVIDIARLLRPPTENHLGLRTESTH